MRRINCGRGGWRSTILLAIVGILVVAGLVAAGVSGAALSAVAIGTGVAVAISSGTRGATCRPRFHRRRT
jgi:hypothetical protein